PGFVEDANGARLDVIPDADATVDPKQSACTYPFKQLCAAGISYKMAVSYCKHTKRHDIADKRHGEWLALAALATVCDIVDLTGENRAIVKKGLEILNADKNVNYGLGRLINRRGYADKQIDTFAAGFVIGPCINATGRLDNAVMAAQLFLTPKNDIHTADILSEKLTALNDERKLMTAQCVKRVLDSLKAAEKTDKVLVITDEDVHESIAGIVAGRVKDVMHRPAIILTRTRGDGELKGSGRSVEGFNLFNSLYANRELFTRFGGHAMAAGMTLPSQNAGLLRERLNNECMLEEKDFQAVLYYDQTLSLPNITLSLAEELQAMAPFGKANSEPLFVTEQLKPESVRVIEDKNTIIFNFNDGGRRIKAVAFGLNEKYEKSGSGCLSVSLVYSVEANFFNGETSVQMRVKDFVCEK
ncbi:MAG: DHHA1 domain-containing protein, partial [Defluviitaleaceae bacterium]|nr:DHHA1 domain-containing protein [Defluviitaleaceae bacterium]